jgi:hypothetical protein
MQFTLKLFAAALVAGLLSAGVYRCSAGGQDELVQAERDVDRTSAVVTRHMDNDGTVPARDLDAMNAAGRRMRLALATMQ